MSLVQFKLKKADASTKLISFHKEPSWGNLASEITRLFGVPEEYVGVAFIDKDKDTISLINKDDLKDFYGSLDHFPQVIKLVVQDLRAPDTTTAIVSTWSMDSNLSDLSQSNDKFKLFCWILRKSDSAFPINISKSETVGDLKAAIKKEMEHALVGIDPPNLYIRKLSPPIPSAEIDATLGNVQAMEEILGCTPLDPMDPLSEHFSSPPHKHLHIVVQLHDASPKHFGPSPMEVDNRETMTEWVPDSDSKKKWAVNGAIRLIDTVGYYYLDPGTQRESARCMEAVSTGQFVLLWGARASGKTTRLFWLQRKLIAMGYQALYFSLESVLCDGDIGQFWESFSGAIMGAANASRFGLPEGFPMQVSSRPDFLRLFRRHFWGQNVVLLIDELSELWGAPLNIRNDCLRALREIRNNNQFYAIRTVIPAGTYSIVKLYPSEPSIMSPFNIGDHVQNPNFTVEGVMKLFYEFAQDHHITIDDAVVEDVWAKSNGHPAMVCLCGRVVFRNLRSLVVRESANIPYRNWQRIPAGELYEEISAYNTFGSMLRSLARPEALAAVALLRSNFVGFLGEVEVSLADQDLADFLTSEGALLRSNTVLPYYSMASPLLDGLIRNRLIPKIFPASPSSVLPLEDGENGVHVLGILIESLKFFDKALIRLAYSSSYKTSKAKISGVGDGHVPRESVYDTELMRILSNWLGNRYSWTVTGQWHLQTDMKKHKYSDIVIKKKDNPTIVLELLATGDTSFVQSHIEKTPEYMALLSANEAWVVHFTCERDYHPIWQSDEELSGGLNVVHFAHDPDFTNMVMSTRWKDRAGNTHENRRLLRV